MDKLKSDWDKVKVLKTLAGEGCQWSAQLDTGLGFNVWMDCVLNKQYHEVDTDWNQYIFKTDNSNDQMRKEYQDDDDNFDICSSLALQAGISSGFVISKPDGYFAGPGY